MLAMLKGLAGLAVLLPFGLKSCDGPPADVALGQLMRERVLLTATANELITDLPIAEGSAVKAGDVLVHLDDSLQQAQVAVAQAQLAEAEADLERMRTGARPEEFAIAEARVEGARAVYQEAQASYERNARLVETGTVTAARLDEVVAQRNSALAELTSAEQSLQELRIGARAEDIRIAEAHVTAAEAQVTAERTRLNNLTIRASRDGLLDSLPWNRGERVPLGSPVAVLLTGDRPYARIYVPEAARARLAIGDPVSISLDGDSAVYQGTLRWISNEPAFTPYYALNQEQRSRLVYPAEVALPQAAAELPAGLPVSAHLP